MEKPKNAYHRETINNGGMGEAGKDEEDDGANRLRDLNDHVSVMDN